MNSEALSAKFPHLYHMTSKDAWPCIQEHGLLSTSALLDLAKVTSEVRHKLVERRRKRSETLELPGGCTVTIRDQAPLVAINKCIKPGDSCMEFLALLSKKVFFWPSEKAIEGFLQAGRYRKETHCVLTFDSVSLLRNPNHQITLTSFNVGYSARKPVLRGADSFVPLCQWEDKLSSIVEVAIDDGVRNAKKYVLRVEHRKAGEQPTVLYEKLSPLATHD